MQLAALAGFSFSDPPTWATFGFAVVLGGLYLMWRGLERKIERRHELEETVKRLETALAAVESKVA